MEAVWHVATLLLALAGSGVVAWWRGREEVRNCFAQQRSEVADLLNRAELAMATARESIEESADRAARERARIEQTERRRVAREPAAPPPPLFATPAAYKRHLERGGKRDRSFEATLMGATNGRAD